MKKTVIGMTYSDCAVRDNEMRVRTYCTHKYYVALQSAGAQVLLLPPTTDDGDLEHYFQLIDGLLLPGGEDVDPRWQNEDPVSALSMVNPWRDEFELKMARMAYHRHVPTLGICRGIQVMAIALGGSVHQDIRQSGTFKHQQEAPRWYGSHRVSLESECLLAKWSGETSSMVNSFHHQAVNLIPQELRATGHTGDGHIEALEAKNSGKIFVGVQWHPEELSPSHESSKKLFSAFVGSCLNSGKK